MMMTSFSSSRFSFPLLVAACALLAACSSTPPATDGSPVTERPASVSSSSSGNVLYGDVRENLEHAESAYQRHPDDSLVAVRYAKALRESGDVKGAKSLLLPLAKNEEVATFANTELAALYLAEGQFTQSESAARHAIQFDNLNYRAWRNLGNALDAQEKYKEGETAFRRALELWAPDDKVPVMNNLALNLAAQGYTDKALTLLYDAQKMAPNRIEIERNIRIIRTLNEPIAFGGEKKPFPATKLPD